MPDVRAVLVVVLWALSCASMVALAGCGSAPPTRSATETLRAYVAAVRADDAHAAYLLLDEATRARTTEADFARRMHESHAELLEQAEALARGLDRRPARVEARIDLLDGERVLLVEEEGRMRVAGGVLDAPSLGSPEDAVLALRRALLRRSLAGALRTFSQASRADVEAEIRDFLEATADPLDLTTEIAGNQARVRLTGGRQVTLVHEEGEWRVVDVE